MVDINSEIRTSIKYWWLFLLAGLSLVILGTFVFLNPSASYTVLSIYFAVTIAFNGCFEIIFSITNRKSLPVWQWYFIGGVLDLIIGGVLTANPDLAVISLPFFVGFWLLFRNVILLGRSFELKQMGIPNSKWLLLSAIAGLILSAVILFNPAFGAHVIVLWTALALGVIGIFYMILSFRLKPKSS